MKCTQILRIYKLNFAFIIIEIFINIIITIIFILLLINLRMFKQRFYSLTISIFNLLIVFLIDVCHVLCYEECMNVNLIIVNVQLYSTQGKYLCTRTQFQDIIVLISTCCRHENMNATLNRSSVRESECYETLSFAISYTVEYSCFICFTNSHVLS